MARKGKQGGPVNYGPAHFAGRISYADEGELATGSVHMERVAVPRNLRRWIESDEAGEEVHSLQMRCAATDVRLQKDGSDINVQVWAATLQDAKMTASVLLMHLEHAERLQLAKDRAESAQADLQAAKDEVDAGLRVEFSVQPELMGFVLGPQGSNLKAVERTTHVTSIVIDSTTGKVRIRGRDKGSVDEAREQLELLVHRVFIPADYVGRIIGTQGANISGVLDTSGCMVADLVQPGTDISARSRRSSRVSKGENGELLLIGRASAVKIATALVETQMELMERVASLEAEEAQAVEERLMLDRAYGAVSHVSVTGQYANQSGSMGQGRQYGRRGDRTPPHVMHGKRAARAGSRGTPTNYAGEAERGRQAPRAAYAGPPKDITGSAAPASAKNKKGGKKGKSADPAPEPAAAAAPAPTTGGKAKKSGKSGKVPEPAAAPATEGKGKGKGKASESVSDPGAAPAPAPATEGKGKKGNKKGGKASPKPAEPAPATAEGKGKKVAKKGKAPGPTGAAASPAATPAPATAEGKGKKVAKKGKVSGASPAPEATAAAAATPQNAAAPAVSPSGKTKRTTAVARQSPARTPSQDSSKGATSTAQSAGDAAPADGAVKPQRTRKPRAK